MGKEPRLRRSRRPNDLGRREGRSSATSRTIRARRSSPNGVRAVVYDGGDRDAREVNHRPCGLRFHSMKTALCPPPSGVHEHGARAGRKNRVSRRCAARLARPSRPPRASSFMLSFATATPTNVCHMPPRFPLLRRPRREISPRAVVPTTELEKERADERRDQPSFNEYLAGEAEPRQAA